MPTVTPYVLCYDPSVLTSEKHALERLHNHGFAKCGMSLSPMRHFRKATSGEITCDGCLTQVACEIAEEAHRNQHDMDGKPHIEHVRRVVMSTHLAVNPYVTAEEIAVRWLHDVIEDSGYTGRLLRENFISHLVVEAVWMLTQQEGQSRRHYIEALAHAKGPSARLAIRTKLIDLDDNIRRSVGERHAERRARYLDEYDQIAESQAWPSYEWRLSLA